MASPVKSAVSGRGLRKAFGPRTVLDGIDGSDGLPGAMPGFRDKLSNADLEALATYLRASSTTLPRATLMR